MPAFFILCLLLVVIDNVAANSKVHRVLLFTQGAMKFQYMLVTAIWVKALMKEKQDTWPKQMSLTSFSTSR
jgi:hypothetical protein